MKSFAITFAALGALALAGCAQTANPPAAPVPTLVQVQNWANVIVGEMPTLVQDLNNAGTLTGQNYANAEAAVKAAQQTLPNLMALKAGDVTTQAVVQEVLTAVQTEMSFIPAAAPFVPLVATFEAVIEGFLANAPVADPATGAALTVVPAVPAAVRG